ncbi:hypothetical protein AAHH78_34980, partial [Burkholderia pseudomallei]
PASSLMGGMKVVVVACEAECYVDIADLYAKADALSHVLAAFMITYPSTHGVVEQTVREMWELVQARGGRLLVAGASLIAMGGLSGAG